MNDTHERHRTGRAATCPLRHHDRHRIDDRGPRVSMTVPQERQFLREVLAPEVERGVMTGDSRTPRVSPIRGTESDRIEFA